jgi:anti-sigma B factor antagonist
MQYGAVSVESDDFALVIGETEDAVVVAPQGELDLATAPLLADALAPLRERTVLLDLRGLGFIDSSGLAVVVTAWRNASDAGGVLRCVEGPSDVHRIFVLSSLDRALDWAEAPRAVVWQ